MFVCNGLRPIDAPSIAARASDPLVLPASARFSKCPFNRQHHKFEDSTHTTVIADGASAAHLV
eukprot:3244337-Amphidinium_carterae.1